jgi:hypothetical protein
MDDEIKRWTARRKSALFLEIIQGKTTVAAEGGVTTRSECASSRRIFPEAHSRSGCIGSG